MTAVRLGPAQRLVLDVLAQWDKPPRDWLTPRLVASIATAQGRRLSYASAASVLRALSRPRTEGWRRSLYVRPALVEVDGGRPQGYRLTDTGRDVLAAARETAGGER